MFQTIEGVEIFEGQTYYVIDWGISNEKIKFTHQIVRQLECGSIIDDRYVNFKDDVELGPEQARTMVYSGRHNAISECRAEILHHIAALASLVVNDTNLITTDHALHSLPRN